MLHANTTVVDVLTLPPQLSLSSQLLPISRLLPPRSGLERSDFVLWPKAAVPERLLSRRCWGLSGLNLVLIRLAICADCH